MPEDMKPLTLVTQTDTSTYRNKIVDGKVVEGKKRFRLYPIDLPVHGQSTMFSAVLADAEHNSPQVALRMFAAWRQGNTLVCQDKVWNDLGKVSDAKVNAELMRQLMIDGPIREALLAKDRAKAEQLVREGFATGKSAEDVDEAAAKEADGVAKALLDAYAEEYEKTLMTRV